MPTAERLQRNFRAKGTNFQLSVYVRADGKSFRDDIWLLGSRQRFEDCARLSVAMQPCSNVSTKIFARFLSRMSFLPRENQIILDSIRGSQRTSHKRLLLHNFLLRDGEATRDNPLTAYRINIAEGPFLSKTKIAGISFLRR